MLYVVGMKKKVKEIIKNALSINEMYLTLFGVINVKTQKYEFPENASKNINSSVQIVMKFRC